MKKVFLSSMMVMFMIAGLCGCVQAKGSWENKVLKQRKAVYTYHGKRYKMKDYPYYKVLDINHDGTNELLIANQKQDKGGIMNTAPKQSHVLLMVNVNGKVKIVKEFKYENLFYLTYKPEVKALGYWSRMSGQTNNVVYTFNGKKLYKKYCLDYYSPNHDEKTDGMNKEDHYYINNKRTSKKAFQSLFHKYISSKNAIHFHKR